VLGWVKVWVCGDAEGVWKCGTRDRGMDVMLVDFAAAGSSGGLPA
jgi:hypothetical protein